MKDQPILVCGGAGYVGSHVCLALADAGFRPIVYDNLSNGHSDFVQWGTLEVGDIRDTDRLSEVIEAHNPVAIMHFAGLIEVGESVRNAGRFYENNVGGSISLFNVAKKFGVNYIVYSSTCAIYGDPVALPIDEKHPKLPLNPYGRSKLITEQILDDYSLFEKVRSVSLRYFNAAGADPQGRIGERHSPETHVIPLALAAALGHRQEFKIFGDDYDTPDGTAVRDYIHVLDLADAHVRALRYLLRGGETISLNLGTGTGTSVAELVAAIQLITGANFRVAVEARRTGDAESLVADSRLAGDILDWSPKRSLTEIVESAFHWYRRETSSEVSISNV